MAFLNETGLSYYDGKIKNFINNKISGANSVETTLTSGRWSSTAPYIQTVNVSGMTANWIPGVPVCVLGTDGDSNRNILEQVTNISQITSADGTLTFTCYDNYPTTDITLWVPGILNN